MSLVGHWLRGVPASTTQIAIDASSPLGTRRRWWRGHLSRSEYAWAIAFCVPYLTVFLALIVYPVGFALWMGSAPRLYSELFADPYYLETLVNTALFVGVTVNLKMVLALFLSGYFMRRGWWVRVLMALFMLPWAIPALPAFMSIHWMLNRDWGLVNNLIWDMSGHHGPDWLGERWSALGVVITSDVWKSLPFWTLILLAGRIAIPPDLREAAEVDGAGGFRMFFHVTLPLIANLYLISTLLATIFAFGDFNTVYFVSGGGPGHSTDVLATLSLRYTMELFKPRVGVAAVLSAMPLIIPFVFMLMRKLQTSETQL
ncbi:MAG: carbohydrate ABC transporter permease [Stellaceae bacterium]